MRSLTDTQKPDPIGSRATSRGIRVMVIDDSLTVRTALSRIVDSADDLEVVDTASSAEIAIRQLGSCAVDVILLDLEMPGMGGLEALPKLLETASQAQVLVVSSLTEEGAEHTLAALSMGAADTMLKPRSGQFTPAYRDELVERVRALGRRSALRTGQRGEQTRATTPRPGKRPRVIAIGASTGGIHALSLLLKDLPARFDLPILITQHLPDSFVPVLARQIEMIAVRETLVAHDGMAIRPGTIVIASGEAHLNVQAKNRDLSVRLTTEPVASGCMPSVDPMLESLAVATQGEALGIILSGMGRDGVTGARSLIDAGGTIFAQDEASSAVWGMPRAVCEESLASVIATPHELAGKVLQMAGSSSWT